MRMRLRLHFAKTEAMRYTSHLDLHRTWERIMRRAGLPLAYSQGFRPHPKINLACALPLGFTSLDEVVDIWLETELPLDQVERQLAKSVPPGIQVRSIHEITASLPALQVDLLASEYRVTMLEAIPDLEQHINALVHAASLPRIWRGKPYDLRPLILEIERCADTPEGQAQVRVMMSAREGSTGRPEEVVSVLGGQPTLARIQRMHLIFRSLNSSAPPGET
jgi:radical SAM-linked protein